MRFEKVLLSVQFIYFLKMKIFLRELQKPKKTKQKKKK